MAMPTNSMPTVTPTAMPTMFIVPTPELDPEIDDWEAVGELTDTSEEGLVV